MGVLLSLVAALGYGTSDFAAGIGGRRGDAGAVAVIAQPLALLAAVVAVLVAPTAAPTPAAIWWGVVAGVGSGVGTLALYRGLAVARMSVVAPLSGVLTAALPALTGALLGDALSPLSWTGVVIAVPAALLVSLHPAGRTGDTRNTSDRRGGVGYGVVAGAGFALLFIALSQAGTESGAWPLIPTQLVSVLVIVAVVAGPRRPPRAAWRQSLRPGMLAGILGGAAGLAYLTATGHGQLAVIAAIAALYPAATVVLALTFARERLGRLQLVGLVSAAAAVVITGIG